MRDDVVRMVFPLVDLKSWGDSASHGSFSGWASIYGNLDLQRDVVMPGAFDEKVLAEFMSKGFISWHHDWDTPVAMPTNIEEKEKGLWLEGEFHGTTSAQEKRTIVTERATKGLENGLSVGMLLDPEKVEWDFENDIRKIYGAKRLIEVALALVPANELAMVQSAKSYLALPDHMVNVVRDVQDLTSRLKTYSTKGGAEGRALSVERREKVAELQSQLRQSADTLDTLLKDANPTPTEEVLVETGISEEEYFQLLTETARVNARAKGVLSNV